MGKKSTRKKRKTELKVIFFIILIAAALFIISTYAWFSTQRNVSITNLNGIVEVAEGLEISLDALNWTNGIVLGTEEGQLDIIEDAYPGHRNLSPTEMLPVSTLGLVTNQTMSDLKMLRGKLTNTKELSTIAVADEKVTDPESLTFGGYFAFDIFLKNSSKSDLYPDVLQLNYDSSLQITESEKKQTGLQNTARVALAKYGGEAAAEGVWSGVSDVMASQETILKETGAVEGGNKVYISDVAIWEPNSNDHAEYIVTNNNKITWSTADAALYATKTLADGRKGFDLTTQMPTYALTEASVGNSTLDVYDWDATKADKWINKNILDKQVVLQTTKTSEEDYTIKEGVQNLISTSDPTGETTFSIAPNSVIRLRIYVWLEGQDVDCINYASHGGGITLNIGLVKGAEVDSHEPEATE